MKKIKFGFATLALVGLATMGLSLPAQATDVQDECVPSAAYSETIPGTPAVDAVYETVVVSEAGWQRYSYTGDWDQDAAPAFPGANWQANVAGDPQNIGVAGAYFVSHGNSGGGDWFYLEAVPEVTQQVLVTPAIPATEDVVIDHPAVVCDTDEPPVVIPNSITTMHTVGCVDGIPTVTITLHNVSPWIYPTSVEIDGVHSYGPTVDNRTDGKLDGPQMDQSKTRTITFAEDSGTHTVRYRVDAGSENNLYVGLPVGDWTDISVNTDCQLPEQPADNVITSDWTDGQITCGDTTVEQSRTVSTTPYVLVEREWVAGDTTVVTETQTRDLTEVEIAENACPAVVVPPKDLPKTLAYTGVADMTLPLGLASGVVLLGGGMIFGSKRKARKNTELNL